MESLIGQYGPAGVVIVMLLAWIRFEAERYRNQKNGKNNPSTRTLLETMQAEGMRQDQIHREISKTNDQLLAETRKQTDAIGELSGDVRVLCTKLDERRDR